jgi:hypothetical protein
MIQDPVNDEAGESELRHARGSCAPQIVGREGDAPTLASSSYRAGISAMIDCRHRYSENLGAPPEHAIDAMRVERRCARLPREQPAILGARTEASFTRSTASCEETTCGRPFLIAPAATPDPLIEIKFSVPHPATSPGRCQSRG